MSKLVLTRTVNANPVRFTTLDPDTIIWAAEAPNLACSGYGEHVWLLELAEPEVEGKYYYTPEWKAGEVPETWEYGEHDTKPWCCFRQSLIRKVWYLGKIGDKDRIDWKRITKTQKRDYCRPGSSLRAAIKAKETAKKVSALIAAAALVAVGFVARPIINDGVAAVRLAACDSIDCRLVKSGHGTNPFK